MKAENEEKIAHRLKIIEGQVRGLQKMVEEGKYCIDVITQSIAIKQALSSVEDLLLNKHLSKHVISQMKSGDEKKAIKEIMTIYKISKKK